MDLRWGITEQQVRRGEVLALCLAEIDRCTHFIGLVGHRYGWVPAGVPPELAARYPGIGRFEGRSLTELEIVHGALRRRADSRRAYCYLRIPASLECRSGKERRLAEAEPADAARVADLRTRIRESGVPVRSYSDLSSLGQQVLADLGAEIERRCPPGAFRRASIAKRPSTTSSLASAG